MANINLYKRHIICSFFATTYRFPDIHISKFVTFNIWVLVMIYNIRSEAIRWQIPDFLSDGNSNVCIFIAFTYQNSHLKMKLENLGLGHGLQHSQWSHSMANINLYKSHA